MKVYRKVVMDLVTGETLEEDSYEYEGEVVECKGENAIFKSQNQSSFNQISGFGNQSNVWANDLRGYMGQRFGEQSQTFNILQNNLQNVVGRGSGLNRLNGDWWNVGTGGQPGGGNPVGGGNAGGAMGGGNASGGATVDPFGNLQFHSGFNPADYTIGPIAAGLKRKEGVMMTQASEDAAKQYQDSLAATNNRLLQMGGLPGSGAQAQLVAQNSANAAAAEAQGQRDVFLNIEDQRLQNARLQAQLGEDIKKGLGPARMQDAAMQNQWQMEQAKMQAQAAAQRAAAAARMAAIRASSAANRSAQNFAEQKWAAQMKLMGVQMQNENFWKGMSGLGSLAQMRDPSQYMQGGLNALQGGANMFQNPYSTSAQGMVATRQSPWMSLLGSVAGSALGGLTGGLTGMLGGGSRGNTGFNMMPPDLRTPMVPSSISAFGGSQPFGYGDMFQANPSFLAMMQPRY